MTNQSTIDKLIEMRLTAMADAFRNQTDDPRLKEVPFEDRFGMLVDIEFSSRKNNRLKRLIRNAGFDQPDASIMDINYTSGRKLNRELIKRLATCEYISEHRNLFITGATGCGKTYMACAFGMEACKQYFNTRYIRLPDLLIDLEMARSDGGYKKVMAKYANPLVLIIDEWLLLKPTETEQRDIFELLHRRRKKSSTIFCSAGVSTASGIFCVASAAAGTSGASGWEKGSKVKVGPWLSISSKSLLIFVSSSLPFLLYLYTRSFSGSSRHSLAVVCGKGHFLHQALPG